MIEVQAPDGTIVRFPEGTPDETIINVMNREYGAPQVPKQRLRFMAQGLTLGAADEIEAGIRSLFPGQNYQGALEEIRGGLSAYQQENPLSSMGYEALGAAVPAIGAAALAPFTGGASTAAVAPTIGRLATVGALQGGAYGFNTGEGGFVERASRVPGAAAFGGAGGAVAGGLTRVAGKGLEKLQDATRRLVGRRGSSIVENEIQRLARQTGKTADEISDDILNGRILAENETIRAAVRAYRAQGGEASRVITEGMTPRPAITRAAAMDELRQYLSDVNAPSALRAQRGSEDVARAAERAAYGQFRDMPAPQSVVDELAESLRRVPGAVTEVAEALRAQTGASPFFNVLEDGAVEFSRPPTVAEAESIRRAIGNRASALYRGGQGGAGEAVADVERGLRGLLDVDVPELAAARATAAGVRGQRDAFEAGRKAFAGDVNEKLAEFAKLTDPEQIEAYRAGLMSAIEARGTTGSRQSMFRALTNPELKESQILRAVLPEESIDDVMRRLDTARASQVTTDYVLGGSPTADTMLEVGRQGMDLSVSDIRGALTADPASMARVASNLASRFTRDLTDAERARVARILVSTDADLVRRAIVDEGAMAALQQRIVELTATAARGAGSAGAITSSEPGAQTTQSIIPGLLGQ